MTEETTIDGDGCGSDEGALVRGEKEDAFCDVLGATETLDEVRLDVICDELLLTDAQLLRMLACCRRVDGSCSSA